MERVIIGILCFLALIIGKCIGMQSRDEVIAGKDYLYSLLVLVVMISFLFHVQQAMSLTMFLLLVVLLVCSQYTQIVFLFASIFLVLTSDVFLTGASFFLYALLAGLIHTEDDLRYMLLSHASIIIVLASLFV